MKEVTVLGIDPGLGITGYGIIRICEGSERLIEGGIIRTDKRKSLCFRLKEIYDETVDLLKQFQPESVVVEELYVHYNHPRTAVIMGHARGIVLLAAAASDIPVISYSATRIKKSLTGNGRASKGQVRRMVMARLGLPVAPEPEDVSDGLAAALCHASAVIRLK